MRALSKILTGAAAAALTVSAAAPAQAQYRGYDRYDRYDRNRGIDAGDIITGVAILGGIAAVASAIGNGRDRYDRGYGRTQGYGYDYGGGYGLGSERASVDACVSEAQRRYGARVNNITDVDRDNGYYRVRGRAEVRDYDYGRYNRGYDTDRESFTCYARNGRVHDFRI